MQDSDAVAAEDVLPLVDEDKFALLSRDGVKSICCIMLAETDGIVQMRVALRIDGQMQDDCAVTTDLVGVISGVIS